MADCYGAAEYLPPFTDFEHTPIDLAEQKCHLDKPKSGEQGLVVMAAGHVAKPKRRSPEGPYALTLILRGRWNIKLGVHTHYRQQNADRR